MRFRLLPIIFALFVGMTTFLTSCGDDPVKGCTDPTAENYNPNAEESDNNCTYARERFISKYSGSIMCSGILGGTVNSDSIEFTIVEGVDNNDVVLNIPITGQGIIPFNGKIIDGKLILNQDFPLLPLPEPLGLSRLKMNGTAEFKANGIDLEGILNLEITQNSSMVTVMDVCPIRGRKIN